MKGSFSVDFKELSVDQSKLKASCFAVYVLSFLISFLFFFLLLTSVL